MLKSNLKKIAKYKNKICIALLNFPLIWNCSNNATGPNSFDYEATDILVNIANNVITPTYSDLRKKAEELDKAIDSLLTHTKMENLTKAQNAWKAARKPWEQSEGFLFGPVDTKGIDPAIDGWPVNILDLKEVMKTSTINTEIIDGLEGSLKGFHAMEFLLFGESGKRTPTELDFKHLQYLSSLGKSFLKETQKLEESWKNPAHGFAQDFIDAGKPGSPYYSQKSAIQELVGGMIGICDEVANGKIGDPLNQGKRNLEESQFSNNSTEDFQDNIRSVQNIFTGTYNGHRGPGIQNWIMSFDSTLAEDLNKRIEIAITDIGNITPSFGEAIFINKTSVVKAQNSVNAIMDILSKKVNPQLN